jgi:hypothetical protein
MAPSTQSNVSATLDVQPSKTNNSQAKASTTTSMPLTGQNPLQATGSQAEKNSTTASRPAHQAAPSHATEPVLVQDKNNDGASDNPTRNADGDAEQHSFSIPHKLSLQSLKKEKTKAKAKHKKLLKKQGLRSGSVSTTHTTQEPRCFSSVSASPHHKETEYHVSCAACYQVFFVHINHSLTMIDFSLGPFPTVYSGLNAQRPKALREMGAVHSLGSRDPGGFTGQDAPIFR